MSKLPTFLGTIQDVKGPTVSVSLDASTVSGLAFVNGQGYRIGQVGSFVRIPIGFIDLFGVVSQIGANAVPERLSVTDPQGFRWMTVQLVGEGQRHGLFKRGLSQYPTIGDQVHLLTEEDLAKVYGRADAANFVQVGHLASAESIPALIDVDKLVTRHSAVVGNTGAGKSTTVAGLLASLTDETRFESARVLILDIHGEYAAALRDRASVFRINPNPKENELPLQIPYWALTFDELLPLTFGNVDENSRGAIAEKIRAQKLAALGTGRFGLTEAELTVDTPIPFSIHQLWYELHHAMYSTHRAMSTGQSEATVAYELDAQGVEMKGDASRIVPPKYLPQNQSANGEKIYQSATPLNCRRQVDSLASKLRDPRFEFLFKPGEWSPTLTGTPNQDLDTLLQQWIGGPQPISILDLSGIPVSILTDLVGSLLRLLYDALFWARNLSEGGRERPLLVVLEEAHVYLGQGESGSAAATVRKIVKEGRKYGIGAMVVSQRPAEVDATILSQCGTLFAMRLSNPSDRSHVTGTVSDNLEGLFSMLSTLRTGEAIIVGEGVHLPVRTPISPPAHNRRPDSSDPLIFDSDGPGGWNRSRETSDYSEVVSVWRKQAPRSPRIITDSVPVR